MPFSLWNLLRNDPRYLQVAVLFCYAISARLYFNFERPHYVTLACVAWAVALNTLLGRFYYKRLIVPVSAVITALSCSLLIAAPNPLIYLLAVSLGLSAKTLFTYKGQHIFNPSNFGVALVLAFLPNHSSGIPQLFTYGMGVSALFLLIGVITVIYAKQTVVSFSWLCGFIVFAFVRAFLSGSHPLHTLILMIGPTFLLFTFHMISDPATTPKTTRYRIAFGFGVAALDALLRMQGVPNGQFYSLIAISAFLPWIRAWESGALSTPKFFSEPRRFAGVLLTLVLAFGVYDNIAQEPSDLIRPVVQEKIRPRAFSLVDVTKQLGLNFRPELPELDLGGNTKIIYIGNGVAIGDFNGDGWMDILLLTGKPGAKNHFYLNQRGTHFVEAAAEWGIAGGEAAGSNVSATVFDYDNDGRPDIYLARMGCSRLYRNTGTRFVDVSEESGATDCLNSFSALPLDYDNDGRLDLYVLRYWPAVDYFRPQTPHVYPEAGNDVRNGGQNGLYRNRDGRTFEDTTFRDGVVNTRWSFDAQVGDFVGDGIRRIFIANDYAPDTVLAIRGGKLVDDSSFLPKKQRGSMNVSFLGLTNDGKPSIYLSNIHATGYESYGNFLWVPHRKGWPAESSRQYGVDDCGWGWGVGVTDFNLDGREDLYVANGFISGSNDRLGYSFPASLTRTLPARFHSHKDFWPPIGNRSWQGHQVDCVFENTGKGFELVSTQVGITESWDGRAVGLIDFDNNGSQDLLVTTMDGPPHLFKNTVVPGKRWIGFKLEGTRSNRDGAGARVEVKQGKKRWFRWATAGHSGFMASSDPRLHFGIPAGGKVDVEVRWPSGKRQKLKNLDTGRYYLVREER